MHGVCIHHMVRCKYGKHGASVEVNECVGLLVHVHDEWWVLGVRVKCRKTIGMNIVVLV